MTNKEKYREFCKTEKDIPIFSKDWWLDAVCGENGWDICLVEKGGQIVASMPYCLKKDGIFNIIEMPPLTQTLGPYIKYPKGQKNSKKLSWEKELMSSLIEQLPKYDVFNQSFHHTITNWLPFYWKGFNQSTRYTYVIEWESFENIEKKFDTDIRRRKKKAQKAGIEVFMGEDIEKFYELNKKTYSRKGMEIFYSLEFVKNLYKKCKKKGACKIFFAKDLKGKVIAANFLVFDKNSVYYIMGGIDPEKKDLGGMDLILYESIKFAAENGKSFDFEGSMIESIEKYFRSFGAVQKPYFQVYKTNSKLWKIKSYIDKVLKW